MDCRNTNLFALGWVPAAGASLLASQLQSS